MIEKKTNLEFAMKVINKASLKGKEDSLQHETEVLKR